MVAAGPSYFLLRRLPRTRARHRAQTRVLYRTIRSLDAYIRVCQAPQRLEIFERVGDTKQHQGDFAHRAAAKGKRLMIACLQAELHVDAVYRAAI